MASPSKSDHDRLHEELTSLDLADPTPSPTFHLFSSLPPELRIKIWRLAAPKPAVVERAMNNYTMAYGLRRRVPALLQVCRESRAELLYQADDRRGSRDGQFQLLHLSREHKEEGKGVYINCSDDTLLICRAPQYAVMPDAANFANIRHLAMEWGLRPCWVQNHCHEGVRFVRQFPQLRTLTLLVSFKTYNQLPLGDPGSKHREQTQKRRALREIKGWVLEALAQDRERRATDGNAGAWPSPEVRVVPKTKFWTASATV
ncbi:uncharacterized protein GLRG_08184 [Colletotrichum graminicola M1.001]|uniref:2EXR domain-containing protein n=1 Tax=Colletotrichum graminicola (strain M1.001 / M2 / FGSC 10212) TaxID=645133 RepID=E3QQA2_COLGM|nr:uncharacterized protein GLRG_08184 [Colletotrichum graminicola M1.001]EFQ33040.1 hypothetical protein GLRG_08184 [Colletotrichum graminicola M1.001]